LPDLLFTENETNSMRLFGWAGGPFTKDAFHEYVVKGRVDAIDPGRIGTKAAAHYRLEIPSGGSATVRLRLRPEEEEPPALFGPAFDLLFDARLEEADAFFESRTAAGATAEERRVARQAYAGLLWSKQFYHYVVDDWLEGDPGQPPPPSRR